MLLFHGTGGDDDVLASIFTRGLLPHGGRAWAHAATGTEAHVFACTSPIGTRDGDPLRWAQGRAGRTGRAWLVVIELPDAALDRYLVGAIRNQDLTHYWRAREVAAMNLERRFAETRAVIAHARRTRTAIRDLLAWKVTATAAGLVEGEPDADTLVQFEAAYLRAGASHKARVAASYGVRIPDWFADDGHYPDCPGCMHNLFTVELAVPDLGLTFSRGAWDRLDRESFAYYLEAIGRWLDAIDPVALDRRVGKRDGLPLRELARHFPPPSGAVPASLLVTASPGDPHVPLREPDTQVLLTAIEPGHLVGAIDLGTADRLSPLVRPDDGETLPGNLRHQLQALRRARRAAPGPVRLA